ncbi:zeaxanthin epoxidase, chloroplastic [Fusarium flagelliforme]|uniref:Zeaxanthin epoxidase, chloroplastic n=1 Tax=Fusarium flagelliforme TaxID=2675880 RepID=A0A395M9P0_9HYPO|nr:zeaxanthin epoxidase, chloroplastic [Fusarium flagelliforme]
MTVPTSKPILIAGSGLASLLLAQSLKQSNIPFKIFERDTSFVFRAQGYRLRLSGDGLDAIESVLDKATWNRFWEACGKTGGSGFKAFDAITGENTENVIGESLSSRDGKIVGIARGDMRRIFAQGCEDYIEWNKNVTDYELTDSGVRAIFSDGSKSVEGSMLVGGEGIYSKTAVRVSDGKLKVYDTGARGIHGQAPTTAFKQLGEGVFRVRDESHPDGASFLITNVRSGDMDNPDIKFGWTMGGTPGVIRAPNDNYTIVGKQAADIAKSISKNWNSKFQPLFEQMDESEAAFWKITCSTPSGVPEWKNEPRVTVIGDAAHSMTPAGGLGANTAVQDSALLGRLLREAGGWSPGVTAAYEKEMRIYGSEAVAQSYSMAVEGFGGHIDEETSPVVNARA